MTSLKRQTQLAQRKKATDITKVSNPASEPTEKTFPIQNFSKPHYRSPTKKLQGCCQLPFLFMKNKLEKKKKKKKEQKAKQHLSPSSTLGKGQISKTWAPADTSADSGDNGKSFSGLMWVFEGANSKPQGMGGWLLSSWNKQGGQQMGLPKVCLKIQIQLISYLKNGLATSKDKLWWQHTNKERSDLTWSVYKGWPSPPQSGTGEAFYPLLCKAGMT